MGSEGKASQAPKYVYKASSLLKITAGANLFLFCYKCMSTMHASMVRVEWALEPGVRHTTSSATL